MFIDCHCLYCPSSVRSDIRAPDVAPDRAREHNSSHTYKHYAPPERGNLCRNFSWTVCATPVARRSILPISEA